MSIYRCLVPWLDWNCQISECQETKRMINAFPKIEVNRSHKPQTESQVHDLTRKPATCIGEGVISKQQQTVLSAESCKLPNKRKTSANLNIIFQTTNFFIVFLSIYPRIDFYSSWSLMFFNLMDRKYPIEIWFNVRVGSATWSAHPQRPDDSAGETQPSPTDCHACR